MPRRHLIALSLGASLLAACSGGEPEWNGHDIAGVMPDVAYELTNESGEVVTEAAQADHPRLMFFGYTYCPDICPITLARIQAALQQLPAAQRDEVRVLFVSVDPDRDDPARLRDYTSGFGDQVIGLTGSQKQLKALHKRFRVTYGYGEPDEDGFYLVSHSSAVFAFDRQGRARLLFNQDVTADQMAADLSRMLASAP
ncbi:SCO family protein [Spectribacter hydrogenoxidans]|uniref:SCO family protein n=1 Tax=Spectribacter hydrogenoxidans TaxID=3075608 RepID=A0ABU3BZR7_9GAMM|nr:SCO family protein [Salinisphaera sp. W335]MDT0634800.1 SCO family protein [Salinisphaera sp. W335]